MVRLMSTPCTPHSIGSGARTAAVASGPDSGKTIVQAKTAKALHVGTGELLQITNMLAHQVAGLWALCAIDPSEYMSLEHSRSLLGRDEWQVGDTLASNRRRAMATLIADASHGTRHSLLAPCARDRHGRHGHHAPDGCEDRFHETLGKGIIGHIRTPCPLYLFKHVATDGDGEEAIQTSIPRLKPYVLLRAEMDLVILVSTFPQEIARIHRSVIRLDGLALKVSSAQHRDDPFIELEHACA